MRKIFCAILSTFRHILVRERFLYLILVNISMKDLIEKVKSMYMDMNKSSLIDNQKGVIEFIKAIAQYQKKDTEETEDISLDNLKRHSKRVKA